MSLLLREYSTSKDLILIDFSLRRCVIGQQHCEFDGLMSGHLVVYGERQSLEFNYFITLYNSEVLFLGCPEGSWHQEVFGEHHCEL